jgi:hypothetical protein
MWQGPPLDLLCQVHEETQHQDCIEACCYRSPTWRVLRALKAIRDAKVVIGESAVTAAPFFESAGRPCKTFSRPISTHHRHRIGTNQTVACTGVKCDLMDSTCWGWECMLQLQEVEDRKTQVATTWAAEFFLREGESREFPGS